MQDNINSQVPIYIFDLDGTIALIDHRRHMVEVPVCLCCRGSGFVVEGLAKVCPDCLGTGGQRKFKPDWDGFFEACDKDLPNTPVIQTMAHLSIHNEIWVWSGRSDAVSNKTRLWLKEHARFYSELRMRDAGDFTPDRKLKKQWLDSLSTRQRERICAVFDYRDSVVDMWRENGIPCFQVATGDF